jgi:hypothetical protein
VCVSVEHLFGDLGWIFWILNKRCGTIFSSEEGLQLELKQLATLEHRGRIVFTQIGKLEPDGAKANSASICLPILDPLTLPSLIPTLPTDFWSEILEC